MSLETSPLSLVGHWQGLPQSDDTAAGLQFGPYRLLRELGRGGMGQVWLAQQSEPVAREVAIKLQNVRLANGIGHACFLVERQALARMTHPYIAQLYDAGTLPDGALFFAMEFVDGVPLDRWLMSEGRSTVEFLRLLIKICEALAYAHERGLLHRDLKPGNILVTTLASGEAIPKVIDFGLALGIDNETGLARDHVVAGTRAYMSPEQLLRPQDGVDGRVDVFALGVILGAGLRYLAARQVQVFSAGSEELRSSFIGGPTLRRPADLQQHVSVQKIAKPLRVIALRAMAADRDLRYQSPRALAQDLQHWLDDKPVAAMDGGLWYSLQCFVRRHRWRVGLGTLALIVFMAGLAGTIWGYLDARAQRALADSRRQQAEALIGFMVGELTDKLRPIGRLDLMESVSHAALAHLTETQQVQGDSAGLIKSARTLRTLAEVEHARGQTGAALRALERADALLDLARDNGERGAEYWFERGQVAYWHGLREYGRQQYGLAERYWQRYADAVTQLQAVESGTRARTERDYALSNLAVLAFHQGRHRQAAQMFSEVLQSRRAHLDDSIDARVQLTATISWLARSETQARELASAHAHYREQLELLIEVRAIDASAAEYKSSEITARRWVGLSALDIGEVAEALAQFNAAARLADELVRFEPDNVDWQRLAQGNQVDLAELQWMAGQPVTVDLTAIATLPVEETGSRAHRTVARAQLLAREINGDGTGFVGQLQALAAHTEPLWLSLRRKAAVRFALKQQGQDLPSGFSAVLEPLRGVSSDLASASPEDIELDYAIARLLNTDLPEHRQLLDAVGYKHPRYLALLQRYPTPP